MLLKQPILGIDLGTTHSLAAVFSADKPVLLPNAFGKNLTPSVVGRMEDGRMVVGAAAQELFLKNPERCVACFKRWMGTDQSVDLGGGPLSAPELSSLVLRSLKADAEHALETEIRRAVISVPAYFNEHQRRATRAAGEIAGLEVCRIINEPTAAALAYGFGDPDQDNKVLVVDLGGGTFDVTLMEIFEGNLEIVATAGESHLGGEDFTQALLDWAIDRAGWKDERTATSRRAAALRVECERAKRMLMDGPAVIRLPDAHGSFGLDAAKLDLDEATFRELTASLMDRLTAPIARVLRDAEIDREEVDEVLLVGGATRMTVLRDRVQELLRREPNAKIHPDETIALGAAVQAALIAEDAAVDDLVVTDVAPFTLGVEVSKELGGQYKEGYYLPIIHRNTTVPVAREQVVSTIYDGQTMVRIEVYQGEARRVERNLHLGTLEVEGIPAGPAGRDVRIRFAYDANGVLDVQASIPSTGERFETVIVHPLASLSDEVVGQSVKRLRDLILIPADDAENWTLLSYAERMLEEVSAAEREMLGQVIDHYEHALHNQDLDSFKNARQMLYEVLENLGVTSDYSVN